MKNVEDRIRALTSTVPLIQKQLPGNTGLLAANLLPYNRKRHPGAGVRLVLKAAVP